MNQADIEKMRSLLKEDSFFKKEQREQDIERANESEFNNQVSKEKIRSFSPVPTTVIFDKFKAQKVRVAGRPKKINSERAKNISICLSAENIDFLDQLSFGRGRSTRIKIILDEYRKMKLRESRLALEIQRGVRIIQSMIEEQKDLLKTNSIKAKELGNQVKVKSTQVRAYFYRLGFERVADVKNYLSEKELKDLEFILILGSS